MRPLLALLLLAAPLWSQQSFSDADFEFSFAVPEGMVLFTPEELGAAKGQPADAFRPVPRAQSPDGLALHDYRWRDTSGHGRDLSLTLKDIAPGESIPFFSVDEFASGVEANFGVEISPADRNLVMRGAIAVGMRVEAERTTGDGSIVRQVWSFFPLNEGDRYALLWMSALVADWELYAETYQATLQSVMFPLPEIALEQARQQATPQPGSARPAQLRSEGWGALEVTGSLVLALLLLGLLFFGSSASGSAA